MRRTIALLLLVAAPAAAQEGYPVGTSDFMWSSELFAAGAEPIAAGDGGAVHGYRTDDGIYLCFLADSPEAQTRRQAVILEGLGGADAPRALPNIPVVCILTQ